MKQVNISIPLEEIGSVITFALYNLSSDIWIKVDTTLWSTACIQIRDNILEEIKTNL